MAAVGTILPTMDEDDVEQLHAGHEQRVLDRKVLSKDVRPLMEIDTLRALAILACQWVVIAIAAAAAIWSGHWAVYLLAMLVISSRQNALLNVMHDAIHYRFLKNYRMGDLISDLFVGLPLGFATRKYRAHHVAHHRHNGADGDPDLLCDPRTASLEACRSTKPASLLASITTFASRFLHIFKITPWPDLLGLVQTPGVRFAPVERLLYLCFPLVALAAIAYTQTWFYVIVLWIIPEGFGVGVAMRIRGMAEHGDLPYTNELNSTRFVDANWLERALIAPLNFNYHLQHHLYPGVPHYNLPRLHKRLMQEPAFREHAVVATSYFNIKPASQVDSAP